MECFADFFKRAVPALFLGHEATLEARALLAVAAVPESRTRDFGPFEILQALALRATLRALLFARLPTASLARLFFAL